MGGKKTARPKWPDQPARKEPRPPFGQGLEGGLLAFVVAFCIMTLPWAMGSLQYSVLFIKGLLTVQLEIPEAFSALMYVLRTLPAAPLSGLATVLFLQHKPAFRRVFPWCMAFQALVDGAIRIWTMESALEKVLGAFTIAYAALMILASFRSRRLKAWLGEDGEDGEDAEDSKRMRLPPQ